MSLRLRLILATGVTLLAGLLVVAAVTYGLVTRSQLSQVDDTLEAAYSPIEQFAIGDSQSWAVIPEIVPGLYVAILDPAGKVQFETPARFAGERGITAELDKVNSRRRNQTVSSSDDHDMRIRVDQLPSGSTLIIGQSLHELTESRGGLLTALAAASGAATAAVLALSWWLVGRSLRPLQRVESAAAAITDSGLDDQRVPGGAETTEVGSLARTLNGMLDRLDEAKVDRENTVSDLRKSEARMRQFVADASHELRTPLAATSAYAELFDSGARNNPDDLARSMTGIRTETARMGELIEDLLLLARLDEDRPLARETVDLTEIVLAAVDAAKALAPTRLVTLHIDGVITTIGDAARLRQVVDNLIGNVRSHTPEGTACEVTLNSQDQDVVLEVSDNGPGVTDEQLLRLTDRFYRVDTARARATGGSGLGLSIASSIALAHGGTLTAAHNTPSGLRLTVTLPNTSAP